MCCRPGTSTTSCARRAPTRSALRSGTTSSSPRSRSSATRPPSAPEPEATAPAPCAGRRAPRVGRRSVQRTAGRAVGRRAHQVRVDLEGLGDLALAVLGAPGQRPLRLAAPGELVLGDLELEQALVHVDDDLVAVLDEADEAAL